MKEMLEIDTEVDLAETLLGECIKEVPVLY